MATLALTILGVVGGVASILGIPLVLLLARHSRQVKLLICDVSQPVEFASVVRERGEHSIRLIYEGVGGNAVEIRGAYVTFIRLLNLGNESIRSTDLTQMDPLRVETRGVKVLDVAVAAVTREVNNVRIQAPVVDGEITKVVVQFDFLDSRDGVLLRLLTDDQRAPVKVSGTVVGIPGGLRNSQEVHRNPFRTGIGAFLAVATYVICAAAAIAIFRLTMGSWAHLWVLLLPVAAVVMATVLVLVVALTVWPSAEGSWPKGLEPPAWYVALAKRDFLWAEIGEGKVVDDHDRDEAARRE